MLLYPLTYAVALNKWKLHVLCIERIYSDIFLVRLLLPNVEGIKVWIASIKARS